MYFCFHHNWNSHESPCPSCHQTITTVSDNAEGTGNLAKEETPSSLTVDKFIGGSDYSVVMEPSLTEGGSDALKGFFYHKLITYFNSKNLEYDLDSITELGDDMADKLIMLKDSLLSSLPVEEVNKGQGEDVVSSLRYLLNKSSENPKMQVGTLMDKRFNINMVTIREHLEQLWASLSSLPSPSLSSEEAAKEYSEKVVPIVSLKNDQIITLRECIRQDVYEAFEAGWQASRK